MKHLLRKLHIGGINGHRPVDPIALTSPSTSASIGAVDSDRTVGGDAGPTSGSSSGGGGGVDFNLLEEEFQVQLALAISASDPDSESAQIDAAKRISLGGSTAAAAADCTSSLVDSLSLRYWSYNVVNYNEKVMDGFYDIHCISTNTVIQGQMPSLADLQALSIVDNVDYEVILVNRYMDHKLRELEKRAYILSLESRFSNGLVLSGLVQKIADVVVDSMGGPVGDADEMSGRWKRRSSELRGSQNSIVLPLGCLDVGLSRHRALLFKVIADRVNLPCMLIKGSYYTGTDDGAVNLIRIEDESEYIIDLMGAPGTLIPVEVPSSHILNAGFTVRGFTGLPNITDHSSLIPLEGPGALVVQTELDSCPEVAKSEETLVAPFATNGAIGEEMFQCHSDRFIAKGPGQPIISLTREDSSFKTTDDHGQEYSLELSAEQKREINMPILSYTSNEGFVLVHNRADERLLVDATGVDIISFDTPGVLGRAVNERPIDDSLFLSTMDSSCLPHEQTVVCDDEQNHQDEMGTISDTKEAHKSMTKLIEPKGITAVLGEGADWEILWEHLQIGERIGIGSYGEVYHAELNGTEVAVKKFLEQDFSGDALFQFKCEIEIMLRLRHPNVVLFMGAVTRPPHLSILTEFLPRGSLYKLLHRPNPSIDEKRRMRMAIDVAKGMNYLHTCNPTVVHRDLKSPNLLVDKNWVVKVCDFGLSRLKHHTFLSSKSTAGTPEWMAPEVLRNEPANEKCDVYSFGVILWELATCQIPWKDLNPMQVVGAVGFQNRRLEIPENVDPTVAEIIHDCWQMEPRLRPSFSQLISRLRQVQRLCYQRTNLTD